MTNIVVINGSPKLVSDSMNLVNNFCRWLESRLENIQVQTFRLNRHNIKACSGCMGCTEAGNCTQHDDMEELKNSMQAADMVVFSSPVHFGNVSSLFQNFIERNLVQFHTFEYLGKKFVNVVSTNGSGEEETDKYLTKIGMLFGMTKIGFIFVSKNDPFKEKEFQKLVEKTEDVLSGRRKLRGSLLNRLYYSSMRRRIQDNPDFFKYENTVWNTRGWFHKSYSTILKERG